MELNEIKCMLSLVVDRLQNGMVALPGSLDLIDLSMLWLEDTRAASARCELRIAGFGPSHKLALDFCFSFIHPLPDLIVPPLP